MESLEKQKSEIHHALDSGLHLFERLLTEQLAQKLSESESGFSYFRAIPEYVLTKHS